MRSIMALLVSSTVALAQPATPTASADIQALQARILQEINASLQCTAQVITLQQEIAKLKADLEAAKKEPSR